MHKKTQKLGQSVARNNIRITYKSTGEFKEKSKKEMKNNNNISSAQLLYSCAFMNIYNNLMNA